MSILLVYSGGMDSTVLLWSLRRDIGKLLFFNYGSRHMRREFSMATWNAKELDIPLEVVDISTVGRMLSGCLVTGEEIPKGHYEQENMRRTVVPFRNGIFASIAVAIAASQGFSSIALACHSGDHVIYPDCRGEFWAAFNNTIKIGIEQRVEVLIPFINMSKRDIALSGNMLGVDFSRTYSCYEGKEKHCGKCGTCVERKEALWGFDTTEYVDAD